MTPPPAWVDGFRSHLEVNRSDLARKARRNYVGTARSHITTVAARASKPFPMTLKELIALKDVIRWSKDGEALSRMGG